jgi:glycosyltransferase 2 family protein
MPTGTAPDETNPTKLERAGHFAARISSLEPADPNLRRGLHAGVGILVVLGIALAVVAAIGDFPDVDWRFRPLAIVLSILGLSLFLVMNGEIWRRLLRALGPELPPVRGLAIWSTSGLGRYVPTSLLLPMLRVAMCNRDEIPGRVTMASIVYEFSLFLAANLAVGAYFVVTLPDLEGDWQRWVVLAIPVLAIIALQPRIFHTLADWALGRLGREPLPESLPGRRVLEFAGLYVAGLVLAGLSTYCLAQCVYPVGTDDLPTVAGSFAVATGLSIVAFIAPGGLGAREAGMALALSPVMPTAPAVAIAVLSRLLQLALEVLMALITMFMARRAGEAAGLENELDTARPSAAA